MSSRVRGTELYDQAHLYGGVDAGLSYILGNMTLGAAIYFEGSSDERTPAAASE